MCLKHEACSWCTCVYDIKSVKMEMEQRERESITDHLLPQCRSLLRLACETIVISDNCYTIFHPNAKTLNVISHKECLCVLRGTKYVECMAWTKPSLLSSSSSQSRQPKTNYIHFTHFSTATVDVIRCASCYHARIFIGSGRRRQRSSLRTYAFHGIQAVHKGSMFDANSKNQQ